MEYVAMIGLLFAPIVCLLCAAWFYDLKAKHSSC